MIVVAGPEVAALLVEALDMRFQHRQRERVERENMLGIFGLTVGLDYPAVHHNTRHLDGERSGDQERRLRRRWPGVSAGLCLSGPPGARRAAYWQRLQIKAAHGTHAGTAQSRLPRRPLSSSRSPRMWPAPGVLAPGQQAVNTK